MSPNADRLPGQQGEPVEEALIVGQQVPGCTLVVYGSYPPVPGAAAAATQHEVLAAWQDGEAVTTVSPRPSAAHMAVRIAGPLAGRRLRQVRTMIGAGHLVFCAEPDVPFPTAGWAPVRLARQALTGHFLARSLSEWDRVDVVVTGDLGVPRALLRHAWAPATQVRGPRPAPPPRPRPAWSAVDPRGTCPGVEQVVHDRAASPSGYAGGRVNALGPSEIMPADWVRRAGIVATQVVFGRRAPAVRSRVAPIGRAGRTVAMRARRRLASRH